MLNLKSTIGNPLFLFVRSPSSVVCRPCQSVSKKSVLFRVFYAKQTQFPKRPNEHNISSNNQLPITRYQLPVCKTNPKQTQTKPILNATLPGSKWTYRKVKDANDTIIAAHAQKNRILMRNERAAGITECKLRSLNYSKFTERDFCFFRRETFFVFPSEVII